MMSQQIETINKETKTIEKNQIKIMKWTTTVNVMKNLPGGLTSRFELQHKE